MDPHLRFTPQKSSPTRHGTAGPPSSPSPEASSPQTRQKKHSSRLYLDFVHIPFLSKSEKAEHTQFSEDPIPSDDEFATATFHSIIGEYKDRSKLFYFAKLTESSQAFKIPAERMETKHAKVVELYKKRKDNGLIDLANFDPRSSSIHPSARITLKFSIPANKASVKASDAGDSDAYSDAESSAGELEDDMYSDPAPELRRSTRAAAQGTIASSSALPFSPKRVRITRNRAQTVDSDSENGSEPLSRNLRRSTRAKKTLRSSLDDDADYSETTGKNVPNKAARKKRQSNPQARPAYGHVRGIDTLNYDSDDETRPLRKHRATCEKCQRRPTNHLLATARKGKKKKSKRSDDEDDEDSAERLVALGGWVQCLKCPLSAHWGCLAKTQRDEILRAILERDKAEWRAKTSSEESDVTAGASGPAAPEPTKRSGLDTDSITEFICGSCMKGGFCMSCQEVAIEPDSHSRSVLVSEGVPKEPSADDSTSSVPLPESGDVAMKDVSPSAAKEELRPTPKELLFRCATCKRLAHYAHLPPPDGDDTYDSVSLATHYQKETNWRCADCVSFVYLVENILAWRPSPPHAVEPALSGNEAPNYKVALPREYLVKWQDRSYRRVQWVPHMWLLATNPAKLKNFLAGSRPIELLPEPVADEDAMAVDLVADAPPDDSEPKRSSAVSLGPLSDAERRIPPTWKTVDRVLDVLLWRPQKYYHPSGKKGKNKKASKPVEEEDEELVGEDQESAHAEREAIFDDGEEPNEDVTETVSQFEERTGRSLSLEDVDRVVWAFFKWNDLTYDAATWDSPPRPTDMAFASFKRAFGRFIQSREVTVPVRGRKFIDILQTRHSMPAPRELIYSNDDLPQLGQADGLKLMPFQVDGVNWLCSNWWKLQPSILADEMGLGKTVQIVTFLGIVAKLDAFPALVVVPNSTITNWVREFERWAPELRVCALYGEARSRKIIKQYELSHTNKAAKTTGAKFHVLVTTFETINAEFSVFKQIPRWEVLVIDEGQRLKNEGLAFKQLNELQAVHRIILTGTPLNNNIRELFTLMSFLDASEWRDLEALAKEHEVLNEDLIRDLHVKLRPYFLRRVKSEVLQLPPKNEVIVPLSMTPLQKEIYMSILSKNAPLIKRLNLDLDTSNNAAAKNPKINMNNIIMELRKCVQHPYLVSGVVEPTGLSPLVAHEKLTDASAKLRLLKVLLPKLKARGHRILLFSQFKIVLDYLEDFMNGEGHKYLRLDGNVKQSLRQKGIDDFNKPGSDIFIYMLSTRAGGVGINLWTADTVIIFDPDYNPHQDLQAISRAHRYGQTKTCLVFKLMMKDTAEESIMQKGKGKLAMDHLIVQNMEDDESKDNIQSILMFGAQKLFEADETQASLNYSEHDIDNLILKTEEKGDEQEEQRKDGSLFAFAKVWSADRNGLDELGSGVNADAQKADSWADTLERLAAKTAQENKEEATGRGVRRRAAAVFPADQSMDLGDTPKDKNKKKKDKKAKKGKGKADADDSEAYAGSAAGSDDDSISNASVAPDDFVPSLVKSKAGPSAGGMTVPLSPIVNQQGLPRASSSKVPKTQSLCGLCGSVHEDGACFMTESPENLAEFRKILLSHAGDESIEERRAAIAIIDETLHKLGKLHLIFGQPLYLVDTPVPFDVRPAPAPRLSSHADSTSRPKPQESSASAKPNPQPRPINGISKPQPNAIPDVAPSVFGSSVAKAKKKKKPLFASITPPGGGPSKSSRIVSAPGVLATPTPGPQIAQSTPLDMLNGTASMKRPSPSSKTSPPGKKVKMSDAPECTVCNGPHHLLKDCAVVRQGPDSIAREIQRLQPDPANAQTVSSLRRMMQQQQDRIQSATNKPEPLGTSRSGAIEISD
ncbi:hypothetical protein EIP91_002326 [Steccherinum ochraceum]|uniref:Chromatin remodeling factor mit1 n=1 Tax=Steccherinum ochraceum TaxID=92696 RepID=A0A4R0RFZ6_9APHY|nr:hypothetical protein EIP91_002326 [Steccherinum ochraceum]